MKWQGRRQSSNVSDRRGRSGGGNSGLIRLLPLLLSKRGLIIIAIFIAFSFITGVNPLELLSGSQSSHTSIQNSSELSAKQNEQIQFISVVLADTEDVWGKLLDNYREPELIVFTNTVRSGCGSASASMGPFYCGADEKIYIDLSFYSELKNRFNAPGDFAEAYVIAHEVGHHIQHLMGISDKVHQQRSRLSEEEYNKLSVRLELQADFLAGVWAHHAQEMKNILEAGDIEEALNAASAIGDDKIQMQTQGKVQQESFTHGSAAQRMKWFKKGFETGDINQGNTFEITYREL